jgi:endoglucanase
MPELRARPLPLLAIAALLVAAPAAHAAPPDAVRVGGPYRPAEPKLAIVLSKKKLVGRRFRVVSSRGRTVLRGRLRRVAGFRVPWRRAAAANFSRLRRAGRYRVVVGRRRSRRLRIRRAGSGPLIPLMLRFFDANSDGREPSPVHGPSHLNDAIVQSGVLAGQRVDLTGGWMDAGDTLKFAQTHGFAVAFLEAAARLDPRHAAALRRRAEVGVRWLVKAHPAPGVFIAQVGDPDADHVGFHRPERDDASGTAAIARRPAFTGSGGDIAGQVAAALALASDRSAGARKAQLLLQARQWYAAGRAADSTTPTLPGDAYPTNEFEGSMAAGAAALFRSTGESAFLADALRYLRAATIDGGFDYSSFAPFAAADICGALGAGALGDAASRRTGCDALATAGSAARDRARTNVWGAPGEFTFGQIARNGGDGIAAALATRAKRLRRGFRVATGARDWLLGRNPWGAGFVVGFGPKRPRHPHHWESLDGPGRPKGAVVGGPAARSVIAEQKLRLLRSPFRKFNSRRAVYEDNVEDYVTSEPAIDYTAASILLVAAVGSLPR